MDRLNERELFRDEEMRAERNQGGYRFTFGLAFFALMVVSEATGLRSQFEIPTTLMLAAGFAMASLTVGGALSLWLSRPGRYRPWLKYLTAAVDLLAVCVAGLTVTYLSPAMRGVAIPGFKSPAWFVLILVALGPAFRFSPTFAIAGAVGVQLVMLTWLVQAILSPHIVWVPQPLDDLFGAGTNWVISFFRMVVTGMICRAGLYISRNSRRVVVTAVQTQMGLAREQFRREQIQASMQRYFPPHIAAALASGEGLPGLGGERRRLVVLMSDIRNFTTAAEAMDAAQMVTELNRYFTEMVRILFETRGTLLAFVGDGILAVYGLPEPGPDDARRALEGAREMVAQVERLNAQGSFPGLGQIRIGVGLHVGDVILGNIGSQERMEFTAMGDTVNTAARVESMNKPLGTQILLTSDFVEVLGEHSVALQPVGEHQVKGKAHSLTLYAV